MKSTSQSRQQQGQLTFWLALVVLLSAAIIFCLAGCEGIGVSNLYENGVVATAAPIASQVGLKVLQDGGNAFDAAVAVGFTLAVVHPEAGNIGGGGFAVLFDAESGQVRALDFRETAPSASTEKMYLDDTGGVIDNLSTYGARAAGVPGTVAGLYELWQEYGSRTWEELVMLAAEIAMEGFPVDAYLATSLDDYHEQLSSFESTSSVYLPDGHVPAAGERLCLDDLGSTLYLIAADGRDGFYSGDVAAKIVKSMESHGGLITAEDLAAYKPIWRQPVKYQIDSLDVYSMSPPSSGGICMGQIIKLLEPYDFATMTPLSPDYAHLFCEAARLAFADRAEHLGDPDFYDVPSGLLNDAYLHNRRSMIDPDAARPSQDVLSGIPGAESDQTTHFSIIDAQGNAIAVTYTLNTGYGCKLVVEEAGFLLNNEMDDFSIKPGQPNSYGLVGGQANKIEPGKRMLSSMSPTIILKDGTPFLVVGSPGGSKIITTVTQVIMALTRFGLSLSEAVALPRFHHQWLPDKIYLEQDRFGINFKQDLIRRGHSISERTSYGDVQAIYVRDDGLKVGVSDPRGNGVTLGY